MEEVFTCKCGCQHWVIRSAITIECAKCETRYAVYQTAQEFNRTRNDSEVER